MCATFGSGVPSACVIDMGDQKTSVCCVEDGLSQRNTRFCMELGGSDITRVFHWLLTRAGFPYRTCDLKARTDAIFMQGLKEEFCHMDQVQKRRILEVIFSALCDAHCVAFNNENDNTKMEVPILTLYMRYIIQT